MRKPLIDNRDAVEYEYFSVEAGSLWCEAKAKVFGPDHTGARSMDDFEVKCWPLHMDGAADYSNEVSLAGLSVEDRTKIEILGEATLYEMDEERRESWHG